jgi:hypothetical protein
MPFENNGTSYARKNGSRTSVWDETAFQTTSGLQKKDLMLNTRGVLVSRRKSEMSRKRFLANGGSFSRKSVEEVPPVDDGKEQEKPHFMESIIAKKKALDKKPKRRRRKKSLKSI